MSPFTESDRKKSCVLILPFFCKDSKTSSNIILTSLNVRIVHTDVLNVFEMLIIAAFPLLCYLTNYHRH